MKTIIELAREAGMNLPDTMYADEVSYKQIEFFATLVEAAQLERLLEGVEMPEPVLWASNKSEWMFGKADPHEHPYHIITKGKKVNSHQIPLVTADQLRETVAAAVARKDAEIAATLERLAATQREEIALRADNERLTRQAFEIAVERDELRMELGDLPKAQSEMLTTIKQLKAENERLRADAARLDWFDKGDGVFRVGDTWYYKTSYTNPARKQKDIRAAIDAAMKGQL